MKDYRRKQTTPNDISLYSKCPKYYELRKGDSRDDDSSLDDIYYSCVRETIIQMYTIELSSGHKAEFHSIKAYFDKIFWKRFPDTVASEALEYVEKGLDVLYQYYSSVYSASNHNVVAVRAPSDLLIDHGKIGVPIELGVILSSPELEEVYLLEFVTEKDEPSSIESKIKTVVIKKESPDKFTTKATFYNMKDKAHSKTANITDDMAKENEKLIRYLVAGIDQEVFYKSETEMCNTCRFKGECK